MIRPLLMLLLFGDSIITEGAGASTFCCTGIVYVGKLVGVNVGSFVGDPVGTLVGEPVGILVGKRVGESVVGLPLGWSDGLSEGAEEGSPDGTILG